MPTTPRLQTVVTRLEKTTCWVPHKIVEPATILALGPYVVIVAVTIVIVVATATVIVVIVVVIVVVCVVVVAVVFVVVVSVVTAVYHHYRRYHVGNGGHGRAVCI